MGKSGLSVNTVAGFFLFFSTILFYRTFVNMPVSFWNFNNFNSCIFFPVMLTINAFGILGRKNWARILSILTLVYWLIIFLYHLYDWIFIYSPALPMQFPDKTRFNWEKHWPEVIGGILIPCIFIYFLIHPDMKDFSKNSNSKLYK